MFSRGSVLICFGSLALLLLLVYRRFRSILVSLQPSTDGSQSTGKRAIVLGTRRTRSVGLKIAEVGLTESNRLPTERQERRDRHEGAARSSSLEQALTVARDRGVPMKSYWHYVEQDRKLRAGPGSAQNFAFPCNCCPIAEFAQWWKRSVFRLPQVAFD